MTHEEIYGELLKMSKEVEADVIAMKKEHDLLVVKDKNLEKVIALESELLAMKNERDDALLREKVAETKVLSMTKEYNDILVMKDKNGEKVFALEEERDKILLEKDELANKEKEARKKYTDLTSLLRSNIECPVCMEVPTSGPVLECENGHIICSKCKRTDCPSCRIKLGDGKSLLAVTILENIEHACKHEGCNELHLLKNLDQHMKICPFRKIKCPAPLDFCGKEVAFCHILDHILADCKGSRNKEKFDGEVTVLQSMPSTWVYSDAVYPVKDFHIFGEAVQWKDRFFYLSSERLGGASCFSVLYLGEESECKNITVEISMRKSVEDGAADGVEEFSLKYVGPPLPVDLPEDERKKNGLVVGTRFLEKIVIKNGAGYKFKVGYNIK